MKVLKSAICSLILLVFLMPAVASAIGQGTDITTSPVSADLNGKPGHSVTTTLQVQNNAGTPVPISIQLETFRAYGTTGQAQILPFPATDDSQHWVHFSKTSFMAPPGTWVPVQMTIDLPSSASLGYYYAVLFKPQVKVDSTSNRNIIEAGNAILVLVDATSGAARPRVELNSFTADKKLYEYLPANFSVSIQNNGNIFLPPRGDIYISRTAQFTHTINTIDINPDLGNVLPGSSRVFQTKWANGFPVFIPKTIDGQRVSDKNGKQIYQLQWNLSKSDTFRFGKYYARLVLVYNNGVRDIPIQATLSFWVIPWKLLGIIVGILILTTIGLFVSGRKFAVRAYEMTKRVHRK